MDDYIEMVNNRIKQAVLDQYATTSEFTTAFNNLKSSLGITDQKYNEYLNASVAKGVSPDVALELFVLTLNMK